MNSAVKGRFRLGSGIHSGLLVAAGTFGGQAVTFALSPVLTRTYTDFEFGHFGTISTIAAVAGVAAAGRLDLAIPLPLEQENAIGLSFVGIRLSVALSFTAACVIALIEMVDSSALGGLFPGIMFAPVLAMSTGAFLCLNQVAARQGQFKRIAYRNVVQLGSTGVFQVMFALFGFSRHGLLLGLLCGQLLGILVLSKSVAGHADRPTLREAIELLREYRRFPIILAPAGVLNALGMQLPLLIVASIFTLDVTGQFTLTQRILTTPVGLVGLAVSQVYVARLGESVRRLDVTSARSLFTRATVGLGSVSAAIAIFVGIAGPTLFQVIFGEAWRVSGEMARIMALSLFGQLVASPLSPTLSLLGRERLQLIWDASRTVILVGIGLTCWSVNLEIMSCLALFATASFVMYLLSWVASWTAIRRWSPA